MMKMTIIIDDDDDDDDDENGCDDHDLDHADNFDHDKVAATTSY